MAVIAIDLGTTGCKSALFEGCETLGSAYQHCSYTAPEDGWAEQDPEFVEFLRQFGQHLKDVFGGWNVFVLTADMALPGQLRIKESKRTPLFNGPLECRLFKFEMHSKRG